MRSSFRGQIGRTTVGSLTVFVVLCIVGVGIWLGIERLDLRSEVSSWQARYDSLADDKSQLDEDYQHLQAEKQELSSQKDALQVDYSELLRLKTSIQADCDTLTTWYSGIREEVNRRLGDWDDKKSFVTPDDAAVAAKVQAVTGGFSEDASEMWADFKNMYDWVVNNIEYNSDTRSLSE